MTRAKREDNLLPCAKRSLGSFASSTKGPCRDRVEARPPPKSRLSLAQRPWPRQKDGEARLPTSKPSTMRKREPVLPQVVSWDHGPLVGPPLSMGLDLCKGMPILKQKVTRGGLPPNSKTRKVSLHVGKSAIKDTSRRDHPPPNVIEAATHGSWPKLKDDVLSIPNSISN